jgi:hypothetical protein
MDPDIEI